MDKIVKLIQGSDMPPELILKKDPDHQLADLNQIMKAAAVDLLRMQRWQSTTRGIGTSRKPALLPIGEKKFAPGEHQIGCASYKGRRSYLAKILQDFVR